MRAELGELGLALQQFSSGTDRIDLSPAAPRVFCQPFSPFSFPLPTPGAFPTFSYNHDRSPQTMVGPRKRGAEAEEEELVALPSDEEDDEEEEE